jgi:DNA polymerase-3 subunit epsilon
MNALFKFFARRPTDPLVAGYLEKTSPRAPAKTPLSEMLFLALDAETTGFDVAKDRMLSLALVEIGGGRVQVSSSSAWLIYQPKPALTSSVSVHGILPAETASGRPEIEVMRELLPRLQGAVIVGHHVAFDAAMLNAAFERHFEQGLVNPLLDTAKLAMRAVDAFAKTGYPGQRAPTLDEVCAQCDLPPMERHTAEGDAFTTATLFLILCARLQRQLGRPLRAGDLPLAAL